MLLEWHDDKIEACGWPWHGLVISRRTAAGGLLPPEIRLPNGATMALPYFRHEWGVTWLFDMGLPDVPDPAVAAMGGAWWGRAIMRNGYCWSGARAASPGFPSFDQIIPLWWPAEESGQQPKLRKIEYIGAVSSSLRISWIDGGVYRSLARNFTPADIGQGVSEAQCAAKDVNGNWRLVGASNDYSVTLLFLGAHANRLLFGVRLRAATSATTLPEPPGTARGSSSDSGAPECLFGLVEVVVDDELFGPDGDPDTHIQLTVLENRQTALGNPTYSLSDVTAPGGVNRTRVETTEQLSALLTAWYDKAGNVRTTRYNRQQVATFDYVSASVNDRHWNVTRSTNIELLYNAAVVDQRSLGERLEIDQADATLTVARTISETGIEDDLAHWEGAYSGGSGIVPNPLPVFRAGQGLVMGVVAYILTLPVHGNVLREQDVRLIWLVAHSNNVSSLCRSREPYDYPAGTDVMDVEAYSGPAIGPAGVVPSVMTRTIVRSRSVRGAYYRSFFSHAGVWWVIGAGNPATGEIARANDYYGYPNGGPALSWV
ncbi:hypothetical protein [Ectopseudomonas hydrolytica]|uniref:hypothetical protein n=1 Tax=Ectopseudomonas hydrolytica TaxID=2493633 RepID=UPI00376F008A